MNRRGALTAEEEECPECRREDHWRKVEGARPAHAGGAGGSIAHRPHAALESGHLHQGLRPHPRACSPPLPKPTAAATPPGHFSFNIPGGRCETCQGDGTVTVEMQFLADVELVCEECKGTRYKSGVLDVRYHGLNIHEVLQLTVKEALSFFSRRAAAGHATEGAGRRRPRLPAAGPIRHHAFGRRSAARQAGRAPGASHLRRARSSSSTSPPPACTSTTSPSCSTPSSA